MTYGWLRAVSKGIRNAQSLNTEAASLTIAERNTCCEHLYDLARLALNAEDATWLEAQGRGVRVARLRALKDDMEDHLNTPGLTLAEIAERQGISERYARTILAEENTTFCDYLAGRRMQIVRWMLTDPAKDHRSVSDLAMAAGFRDLSWFNKCYQQMFDETPSDSRTRGTFR